MTDLDRGAPEPTVASEPRPRHTGSRVARWGWVALAAVPALVCWLGSGVYVVAADERGVVRHLGAVAARVGPGMHYRLPWPVGRVDVLKATSVMKAGAGFALPTDESQAVTGVELLTGDTNILSVALVLQFVVRDPADYLVRIEDPRGYVGLLAQAELTEIVAGMPVDEVLTTGRLAVQDQVRGRTQAVLDRERSGIPITSSNIMAVTLDRSVAEAFQAVVDAVADREKARNEANTYANALLPKARGEAAAALGEAQNDKRRRVAEARAEAERFLALAREYEKAPEVSRARIYFESIDKILSRARLYVVDSEGGRVPLNLRLVAP